MANDGVRAKLLSHRLRGFDSMDGTRRGLAAALAVGVRHVEFDVRFTRDDHAVIHHDSFFTTDHGARRNIEDWSLSELRQQASLENLATLDDMCAGMAEHRQRDVLMHVDVKVAGREKAIYQTIAKHGLLQQTVLVSWLPDALVQFNAISPGTRLCLSHLTFARAPWLFPAIKAFYPLGASLAMPLINALGRHDFGINPDRAQELLTARPYFDADGDVVADNAGIVAEREREQTRLVQGHIVPRLVAGKMLDLLRRTRGLVCVPVALATKSLKHDYNALGVQLAVYSVKSKAELDEVMGRVDPDIVYVDNADLFTNH